MKTSSKQLNLSFEIMGIFGVGKLSDTFFQPTSD